MMLRTILKKIIENILGFNGSQITDLNKQLYWMAEGHKIFDKAFKVAGFSGDYLEFGAYKGDSLTQAFWCARNCHNELMSGQWDHSFDEPELQKQRITKQWNRMRFIAFDSFEGIPKLEGIDKKHEVFPEGTYSCSENSFLTNIKENGVDIEKVNTVKGFFNDTLNSDTINKLSLKRASIIHIDSDLYSSAKEALNFVTPLLVSGSIIIFDDWYQFSGNPTLGEQRAFSEWRNENPEWIVTEFQKEGPFRNSFIVSKP